MGFLNPGLLGLLGLGAIPVLIHLLNRRRYQIVRWPAMAFLLKAQVKTRQRLRMENLLLLLARTLAVLLFAFAASRPFLPSSEALAALAPDRQHLYILVDNSASMGYQEGISTLLQRAVRDAKQAVDNAVRADDPVTLVIACDEVRRRNGRPLTLLHGTRDHAKAKETLDRIPLSDARLDPAAALAELASVAEAGDPRRTLLILSDFQQTDWGVAGGPSAGGAGGAEAAKEPQGAGAAIKVQLDRLEQLRFDLTGAFRFMGGPDLEDLAVLSVGPADGRVPAEGRPVAFEVVVGNSGPGATTADVRFGVGEREAGSQRVSLRGRPGRSPAPETARVSFQWTGAAGDHHAWAEVAGPGNRLRANDRRGHAFPVRERIRVLLVDGDPAPARGGYPETWLLEASLSLRRGVAPAEVRVVPGTDLGTETFAGTDVAVLANVDRVPDAAWDRLASFVRGGGGLLVFLGDRVDPSTWNAALRRPGSEDLLPARLASHARFDGDAPVSVDLTASEHPALRDLTDPRAGTSFDPPLVSGWWPVQEPVEEGAEVLLRLRDVARSPYLLERHHGRGRALFCASSADLDWTGSSLLFAPLVQELVSYLASAGAERRDLLVHEPLVAGVPDAARDLSVASTGHFSKDVQNDPNVEAVVRPGDRDPSGALLRAVVYPGTARAGRYAVRWRIARDLGGAMESVEVPWAVDIDPREADLARMRPEVLEERFQRRGLGSADGAAAAVKAREREAARGDLTGPALALGLGMLLVEMFLAAWFGRRRR